MAFNFGNWLEEAWANVNPFDNGATAKTVVAARKRKAAPAVTPAQTSSPTRIGGSNQLASPKAVQLTMPKTPTISTTKLMNKDEIRKKNLAEIDAIQKKAQADIWNPAKIAGDIGNSIGQVAGGAAKGVVDAGTGMINDYGKRPTQIRIEQPKPQVIASFRNEQPESIASFEKDQTQGLQFDTKDNNSLKLQNALNGGNLQVKQPEVNTQRLTVASAPASVPKISLPPKQPSAPKNTYTDYTMEKTGNKKLFGVDVGQYMGDYGDENKMTVGKKTQLTEQDLLKGFDNIGRESAKYNTGKQTRDMYVNKLRELAQSGDENAKFTLDTLQRNGKLKGSITDVVDSANNEFLGGINRSAARAIEWLPGGALSASRSVSSEQGTGKWADNQEKIWAGSSDMDKIGKTVGQVERVGLDVGLILTPAGWVDKTVKGTRFVQGATNLNKGLGFVARTLPGSATATGMDMFSQASQGNEQDLAKSAALGTGVDLALPVVGKVVSKIPGVSNLVDNAGSAITKLFSNSQSTKAAKDPRVVGYGADLQKLQQAFDTTPDPVARRQIGEAIVNARSQRRATYNQVKREMSQGGYHKNPLANEQQAQVATDPLQALKQEALKYKSADEFVKNTDHTPQTTRVYIKSKFRDGGGYADVPVIREEKNITLYQGGTGENRQFWTPNKEYAKKFGNGEVVKKTGNFYQIDNGNRMTDVYVDADKQLTDLYNQAHAQSAPVRLSGLDGKPIETDGKNVILYHRTSPESAKNIQKAGYLDPMKAGTGNDRAITQDGKVSYLTTNPSQDFYGESVVKVKMPIEEFKRQIENNKAIVAKLEEELATGKVPEIYRQDTLRMIENIKANPEILSSKPLSITESAPVKTTGASDNKINTLEQKPQETQAQLKDTSNTEVQAGKIQNPSPYKGDYTTKAAENKPEDPLAIVDELFPSNKPVPKQRLTKAERQEVDAIIHEQDPNLLYRTSNFDKQKLTESSDNKLPRIHVNDLKRYFGNTENIPAKYKRTTGREDLDLLAQRAGYDDVDKFMQDFEGELDSRAQLRADTELLKEFRNDPETIKLARERIAARKAAEPKQIKVKGSQPTKNVPVTQVQRTGDVVTTSNVNPNLKSLSEKRYSVADDGELMPDKKGATSVFTDKDGRVKNIRIGDKVYGKEDFGDLSDVNGYGSTLATMRRNVERGFGKQTGEKLGRFLVDHQQDQATKMVERKLIENQGMKQLAQDLGINFKTGSKKAKKVSAAIQDFGEGVRDKASLVDEFGQEQADKIVAADKWFRKQYDTLLNEANKTLTQYGYDPIPKRKNYYTHFQDESVWKKFGLRMDDVRRTLGDPTLQDAMPDAPRGKIDNKLAGQSEFTQPGKRFNRFALQRKGNQHTADAFQAFERYLEPTLNNIYMTPSISRARVISRAVAQDANVMGKDANGLLIQMKEWANDLAGKSNRFDRPLVDSNWGSKAIKTSQWLQKKAGQNTIVGNLSTAVMQPIVLAQTAGKFGYKNTALGLMRAAGKDSVEMTQSKFLKRRYSNLRSVTETKMDSARHAANVPLEVIEETATKSTWEAAYLDAKDKGLAGKEAIRYADVETEKTVAGRSIGEKPEIFRSKAAGFMTQYQLEVSNYWQQLGKEMSKKQALKVFVAAYGINSLLQATTGRRVGFDPISAAIDMYGEIGKDEKSPEEKLKTAGQRALGEVADNLPFVPMIASTVMGQKNYQKLLGPDSQGGRFGVSSPISTVVNNPAYLVAPFGGAQVKKTTQGAQVLLNGKMTNKDGETVVDVPQTPANIARGLLYGPSAIPEVNQYYNNLSKKKVDQKPVDNQIGSIAGTQSLKGFTLAQQKDLQSISGPARDTVAAKFLAENKARRAEDAKKKTMTPEQKKSYSSDKRIDGYIADNVSKDTTSTLTKYYTMKPKDREAWFAKESDAEYKYYKAKYENDKANGEISKIEDIRRQKMLKKDEVGAKYTKDTRDLYSLSKAEVGDYLSSAKNGNQLAKELIAYDEALYNAGLVKYKKFRYGFASTSGGGKSRGGRKSSRNGAKKFSYSLSEFAPKKGTSKNKQLYDLLKEARKKYA